MEGIKETPAIRNPILLNTTVGPFITVTLEKRPPCRKQWEGTTSVVDFNELLVCLNNHTQTAMCHLIKQLPVRNQILSCVKKKLDSNHY